MNYKIVTAHKEFLRDLQYALEEQVNSLIAEGYKPQGGVSISTEMFGYKVWYTAFQAMIKEE